MLLPVPTWVERVRLTEQIIEGRKENIKNYLERVSGYLFGRQEMERFIQLLRGSVRPTSRERLEATAEAATTAATTAAHGVAATTAHGVAGTAVSNLQQDLAALTTVMV